MSIEVNNVFKHFGNFTALNNISIDFPTGELVALLGPSGCGKTSLLRVIAGLERPNSGSILINGEDTQHQDIRQRQVGFVFQHYALFKHMTIFENVAFGLRAKPRKIRPNATEIRRKVMALLEMVQLDWVAERYPAQLSGGQRQRVALARALAIEPRVLLLDEPFGALDAKVRKELRRWLRSIHDELNISSLFVTHDQEEAMEVSDKVVVMNKGQIEQIGSPEQIYEQPASEFVYQFIGSANRLTTDLSGEQPQPRKLADSKARTYCRPHDLVISTAQSPTALTATLVRSLIIGAQARLEVKVGELDVLSIELPSHEFKAKQLKPGQSLWVQPIKTTVFN